MFYSFLFEGGKENSAVCPALYKGGRLVTPTQTMPQFQLPGLKAAFNNTNYVR